ncbi:polypeptide N-acetylgalactosaminyltransferase-like 6 [Ciona intestinalis]
MRFKLRKCVIGLSFGFSLLFLINELQKRTNTDLSFVAERDADWIDDIREKSHGVIPQGEDSPQFLLDSNTKIDWHNPNAVYQDRKRIGPGELGVAVHLSTEERSRNAYSENGFNILVSNRISLNRSLPDIRHKNCASRKYLAQLPDASIIIPFHNEGRTTLLRTIHSIINRTPKILLREIILVDDCSTVDHLKSNLDQELSKYRQVKLVRLAKREGLIRARLAGVHQAKGNTIVILDSHVEVTNNWLPPLLEPIALDRKVITCPMIDIINKDDFHYLTQPGDAMRGAFDWELYYKRIPIPPEKQLKDPSDPFEDPVMAGGLFAIDRLYFKEIGEYDDGLEIWGGEQYELSFKAWMCGGKILDAPCSRVGHIYREFMPYSLPPGTNINKNFKRVAEVWMDEYAEYFYKKRPHVRGIHPGDLSKQKALRELLECRSFDWFMKEVAPDIIKHYPPVMPEPAAWGMLSNEGSKRCLDGLYKKEGAPLSLMPCRDEGAADQSFILTWKEDIRPGANMDKARKFCLDGQGLNSPVVLWQCHGQYGNQLWKYKDDTLIHGITGHCATADAEAKKVILLPCKANDINQRWSWTNLDLEKLEKFNKKLNSPA